jgi:hypothetical protein
MSEGLIRKIASFKTETVTTIIFNGKHSENVFNDDLFKKVRKQARLLPVGSCFPNGDVINIGIFIINEKQDITAYGSGGIYSTKKLYRHSQWLFGNNRERSMWIDAIWSDGDGRGTFIVKEIERFFLENIDLAVKKNIYVLALKEATPFYKKLGYDEIQTNEHDDDDDYPYVFHSEVGVWYAKPLVGETIDREEIFYDFSKKNINMIYDLCKTGRPEILDLLNEEFFNIKEIWKYIDFPDGFMLICMRMYHLEILEKICQYIYTEISKIEQQTQIRADSSSIFAEIIASGIQNKDIRVRDFINEKSNMIEKILNF